MKLKYTCTNVVVSLVKKTYLKTIFHLHCNLNRLQKTYGNNENKLLEIHINFIRFFILNGTNKDTNMNLNINTSSDQLIVNLYESKKKNSISQNQNASIHEYNEPFKYFCTFLLDPV